MSGPKPYSKNYLYPTICIMDKFHCKIFYFKIISDNLQFMPWYYCLGAYINLGLTQLLIFYSYLILFTFVLITCIILYTFFVIIYIILYLMSINYKIKKIKKIKKEITDLRPQGRTCLVFLVVKRYFRDRYLGNHQSLALNHKFLFFSFSRRQRQVE